MEGRSWFPPCVPSPDPRHLPPIRPSAASICPGPLTIDGVHVTYPELIPGTKVVPKYPELARRARTESRVVLQVVVDKDGSVGESGVLSAPMVDLGLEAAARKAVSQ